MPRKSNFVKLKKSLIKEALCNYSASVAGAGVSH